MIQSNDGGANVSFDGGRTWSSQMNQPTAEIYGVWIDNQFPYKLYGAQQDNTHAHHHEPGATRTTRDDWRERARAARPARSCRTRRIPNIVYGSCKGQYSVMNLKTGQEKNYWIGAQSLYGNPGERSDLPRFQRVSPMATSPHDPDVLYYGSQYVHRTRDKGVTWEKISPDLTANPDVLPGRRAASRSRATSPARSSTARSTRSPNRRSRRGVIWTGSNDGPFHVTRDNGKTWTNVTPKDLPTGRPRAVDRRVAASQRLGVLRGLSLPARRLRSRTSTRPTTTARRGRG